MRSLPKKGWPASERTQKAGSVLCPGWCVERASAPSVLRELSSVCLSVHGRCSPETFPRVTCILLLLWCFLAQYGLAPLGGMSSHSVLTLDLKMVMMLTHVYRLGTPVTAWHHNSPELSLRHTCTLNLRDVHLGAALLQTIPFPERRFSCPSDPRPRDCILH